MQPDPRDDLLRRCHTTIRALTLHVKSLTSSYTHRTDENQEALAAGERLSNELFRYFHPAGPRICGETEPWNPGAHRCAEMHGGVVVFPGTVVQHRCRCGAAWSSTLIVQWENTPPSERDALLGQRPGWPARGLTLAPSDLMKGSASGSSPEGGSASTSSQPVASASPAILRPATPTAAQEPASPAGTNGGATITLPSPPPTRRWSKAYCLACNGWAGPGCTYERGHDTINVRVCGNCENEPKQCAGCRE